MFLTKLREIEDTLSLRWNESQEYWEVWDSKPMMSTLGVIDDQGGRLGLVRAVPYRVLRWSGPKGEFMSLDNRLLLKMRMLKQIRDNGYRALVREIDEHNTTVKAMKEQGLLEDLTYMIREDKQYWKKWISDDLGMTGTGERNMSRIFT